VKKGSLIHTAALRDCVKTQIPPASAAWYFNVNLGSKTAEILGIQKDYHSAAPLGYS
jgi:hypothetical protein